MQPHSADETQHPIRVAQRRIANAFAIGSAGLGSNEKPGLFSCLIPIAESVRWQGTPRQIAEAMPHELPVADFFALRAVLQRIGIQTERVEFPPDSLRSDYCPYLLAGKDNHVTLVSSIGLDGSAQIYDSRTASWRIARKNSLTGTPYLVTLKPAATEEDDFARDGFVWLFVKRSWPHLKHVVGQSFAINALGLILSLYIMYVYDKAIGTKSVDTLLMLFLGCMGAVALELWIRMRRGAAIARLGARFDALTATGALKSVLGLPLAMGENTPLAAQLSRFKQFQIGRELFGGSLATSLLDLPFTLVFFLMMFVFGGFLGFVPLAFATVLIVIGIAASPRLSKDTQSLGDSAAKSEAILVELCSRLRSIWGDNAEDIWLRRSSEAYRSYLIKKFNNQQFNNNLQVIAQAGVNSCGAFVLGLGAVEVMRGTLSLGALVALMAVTWRILGPMQVVFLSFHRFRTMYATTQQIARLFKMKGERDPDRGLNGGITFRGSLSLSGVCFRYANRTELTLKGISLEIGKGELIAVTGPSGSGKSTLLRVMMGLYQSQSGSIRLDDFDMRQLDPIELRQIMSFLGQEPAVFFGTVAQNLRLVAPEASDGQLLDALEAMGISANDPALPEGLQTRFNARNKRAMSLSFMQRFAVAQAFLRDSPVILLDEPATHMDMAGDAALIKRISQVRGKRTIVMTTARPSHMKLADRIVLLNEGAVAGVGRPDDVLPMISSQFARMASR